MPSLDPQSAQLLALAKSLVRLLESPEPGLSTWCEMTRGAAVVLRDQLLDMTAQPNGAPRGIP